MNRHAPLWLVFLALACGPGLIEGGWEEPPGEYVPEEATGEELADPDPEGDACAVAACPPLELEPLPEEEEPAGPVVGHADAGAPPGAVEAGDPRDAGSAADAGARLDAGVALDAGARVDAGLAVDAGVDVWGRGAPVVVRGYAPFRSAPRADAATLNTVEPRGGVTNSAHGGGMPLGLVPPGQTVTLVTGTATNGFYEVRYAGVRGWVAASSLSPLRRWATRYDYTQTPAGRQDFFKHQLRRGRWNKDGPSSSSTCAPTSLAMAVHAFGKEPQGLSVEQSIHRTREAYGVTTDSVGTTRGQINTGAQRLGLSVRALDTRLSTTDMLTRLDTQLGLKRMVVLEGQPSSGGAFHQAFNRAYAAAGLSRRYTFAGRHSLLVMGREGTGYLVADPLSEVGVLTLTRAELRDFITAWGGTGNAVWAP